MSPARINARTRAPLAIGFAVALLWLLAPIPAESHATSTSYLIAHDTGDRTVTLTWDLAVPDLHWTLDLDADGDGAITWREIEARRDDIATLAASHLRISRTPEDAQRGATHTSEARRLQPCTPRLEDLLLTEHAGEPHLSLTFAAACDATGPLAISATLFFDKDATQRTLIDVTTPAGQFTGILSPSAPEWREPAAPSLFATFGTFVGQGLWHVWIGYDHLAFLLLLLLPGVLRSTGSGWRGTRNFSETARDLLRIVTAFTVAHSVTLALAATGTVHVPVRPVEMSIAFSIVVAGLLNLFPAAARARLGLAFGFGLIHGFGFANALAELGAHGTRLVPTLAGFNVGIELAQVSLVVLVLPFLLRARHSRFYAWRFMPVASVGAAMAGAAWLAARAG
ncbi:MAG TPA: HupE/UreJ family protein [Steroidobacteraceae bacterium]|nr:HupE/UreJ family protein [Steroidobacteraceae bacterium]